MEKITKRQMYTAMINFAENGTFSFPTDDGVMVVAPDEIVAFAENEIELLDKKVAKAKESAAKKKNEADALMDQVKSVLTNEFHTIADIAAAVSEMNPDVTVSKTTYRLTRLVEAGIAEKAQVSIPATDGSKARKVQGYRLINQD